MPRSKTVTSNDKMYCSRPLISGHKKSNRGKKYFWKIGYVTRDVVAIPFDTDTGVFNIRETSIPIFFSMRKTVFIPSLCIAFILGFTLGAVIPFRLSQIRIPHSRGNNVLANRNNYNVSYEGFLLSQLSQSKKIISLNRIVEGIFWSKYVEQSLPRGFGDVDDRNWNDFVKNNAIVRIEPGCGRMQNRLVTFADGTKACCRYRQNTDQIQGEIFSYHLGRRLNLKNLVPSTLAVVNTSDQLWFSVKEQLEASQWLEDHPVVLTKFVEHLLPADIPETLRQITRDILVDGKEPSEIKDLLRSMRSPELQDTLDLTWIKNYQDAAEMAQWSDLIVFDYLTANLDRFVNNLYNLQWNRDMVTSPTHNLARTASSHLLLFLDNESGLLHGYRLLDKYEPYHSFLLERLCVFRKSTVDALSALQLNHFDPDPFQRVLPSLPDKNVAILGQRVARVLQQVVSCARKWQTY